MTAAGLAVTAQPLSYVTTYLAAVLIFPAILQGRVGCRPPTASDALPTIERERMS
jgi:hypothetical protein